MTMDTKNFERLELNKILSSVSEYAVLDGSKRQILSCIPSSNIDEVRTLLAKTEECDRLLYRYGVSKIEYFGDVLPLIERASKKSTLSCGELLQVNAMLLSVRSASESITKYSEDINLIKDLAEKLYYDTSLERDISKSIISDEQVADNASEKLYSIRSSVRRLNEKIRLTLSDYLSKDAKYLQDGVVTIRNDRFVIPVKAEYKSKVKGLVHDRSKTGATYFIEPEYVFELNNELIAQTIAEREEIERILHSLSLRIGNIFAQLSTDMQILYDIDEFFARAEYSYINKCSQPKINDRGYISILKGRHPLIDKTKIVPVSIELGGNYDMLILSGANTGGKTVTLKMCGLFTLMTACGIFIQASEGSCISVFENVFCDIGDRQSIEESLSTFSSHLTNIINICDNVNKNTLILIDEIGGGTNPDEGQALAKAIVGHLLAQGCKGIVTTHFTPLKEFAYTKDRIENACMEFDANTLKPLYRIKTGIPGASNAMAISRRLGLSEKILNEAYDYLSEGTKSFENIVCKAEESRVKAEEELRKVQLMQDELNSKLASLNKQIQEVNKEKEKISRFARVESRRIIAEKCERAEEILSEIEEIFKKEELTQSSLIKVRTLKNKMQNISFDDEEGKKTVNDFKEATKENLKVGMQVFIKSMQCRGEVLSVSEKKGEVEVLCGNMRMHCKILELLIIGEEKKQEKIKVIKNLEYEHPVLEINVLGLTVPEAIYEVDNFIDKGVTSNLEEIKVIHGVGTGKLKNAIAEHLRKHKRVESFRLGKYGEGETGVTIIKLK